MTSSGGVAVFVPFLAKIGLVEMVRQRMQVHEKSPNHVDPTAALTAFLMPALVGARRFARASLLRGHHALHALLGLERLSERCLSQVLITEASFHRNRLL